VLQVVEWFTVGFGPADGGYASVFFGWTAFNVLFVAGTLLWLENLLATAIRYRTISVGDMPAPGHASGDPGRLEHDVADPLSLLRPGLEALSFYWTFLAGLGVLAWIVLYLI
jgi:heme/copper-type cytochrome/quinol oxidase subunit 3